MTKGNKYRQLQNVTVKVSSKVGKSNPNKYNENYFHKICYKINQ